MFNENLSLVRNNFLKDRNYEGIENKDKMVEKVEEFHKELYSSNITVPPVNMLAEESTVSEVTPDEVVFAFKDMRRGKAPGQDYIGGYF